MIRVFKEPARPYDANFRTIPKDLREQLEKHILDAFSAKIPDKVCWIKVEILVESLELVCPDDKEAV